MRRRQFIRFVGSVGLTALAGPGSTEERVWGLGVLTPLDWRASSTNSILIPELARRGFVEGRNLIVLPRGGSNTDLDKLTLLAQDLATAQPDVIVAVSPNAVLAAMKAAPRTPMRIGRRTRSRPRSASPPRPLLPGGSAERTRPPARAGWRA